MTAEEFLRSKGYDAGEEPSEGVKDLLDEFGELSRKKETDKTEILTSVINHIDSYVDKEMERFFKWYKINEGSFYDGEQTDKIVAEYRRANKKIRSGEI